MKNISYKQMEQIEGGGILGCAASIAGLVATIGLAAVTGPGMIIIGWYASGIGMGISCADALAE